MVILNGICCYSVYVLLVKNSCVLVCTQKVPLLVKRQAIVALLVKSSCNGGIVTFFFLFIFEIVLYCSKLLSV